jgi:branched-chain amino acid transport system ATP-binding protein
MLSVRDLHVDYGSIAALRGVSIEVGEGEVVAVIGPNGAGKSTLLLTIAGIARAKRGAVELGGTPILGISPEILASRGLSLVPEGRHIFASLTVAENIALGATTRRDHDRIAADTRAALAMFPILSERYGQRAGKLSGGEQQMLAIARALMSRPKLLLLDEPSLGLAPLIVKQVYDAIDVLKRQGITVLIVEQSVHRAIAAADRTYVMQSGRIAISGRSGDLHGTAEFDAAYFGVPAENGPR